MSAQRLRHGGGTFSASRAFGRTAVELSAGTCTRMCPSGTGGTAVPIAGRYGTERRCSMLIENCLKRDRNANATRRGCLSHNGYEKRVTAASDIRLRSRL